MAKGCWPYIGFMRIWLTLWLVVATVLEGLAAFVLFGALTMSTMAFASKGGRWIQREGKIRNPFEGSRMLACGAAEPWTPPAAP